ncbi:MAG: 4-aminobutyrate aminotransferase apoenzyme [Steroidobacteraceae bacterium]|nr:4-aminobutyrate aminotransferase apoenzyme [Steroidobacteraceae bacterium]MBM2853416.1 4-aminobutyrate aminotransferase apoenzyme [Steroidobacteraceae bacterium]
MKNNESLVARRNAAVARGVSMAQPIFIERAENALLWDADGNRYVDFAGGIAVLNTGHRHPRVLAAVRAQLEKVTHTCFQITGYEPYVALCERLNKLAPGAGPHKTLLMSTGAEAVENAVKIARVHTGRSGVISFAGSFHGRTMMALALTGKVEPYKAGFGPMPGEVYHVPFPNALHGVSVDDSLAAIAMLFKCDIEPARVAAIMFEPVQGEGGFYVAPKEFVLRLRELCDKHGIVLIADEIQCGAGRTGRMFAMEHYGVAADISTLAKSLAGGFPLSAVVGRAEVMDACGPGGLGGTYAGNPVACAAALAVLDVFEQEQIFARAINLGTRLTTRLKKLAARHPSMAEIRGLGAMVAFELCEGGDPAKPAVDLTKALTKRARELGLILLSCGIYGNVIRILVPITAEDAVVDEGLGILERALDELEMVARERIELSTPGL